MQPTHPRQRCLRSFVATMLCAVVGACAGNRDRPVAALAIAQTRIEAAEDAQAAIHAAAELDLARDKLADALRLADDGEADVARRLAEQAAADARLAEAAAMSRKAQQTARSLRDRIDAIRDEIDRQRDHAVETADNAALPSQP